MKQEVVVGAILVASGRAEGSDGVIVRRGEEAFVHRMSNVDIFYMMIIYCNI